MNTFYPEDGGWTIWSNWTMCSLTCGGGLSNKTRVCDDPMPIGDGVCPGNGTESMPCNQQPCPSEFMTTVRKQNMIKRRKN